MAIAHASAADDEREPPRADACFPWLRHPPADATLRCPKLATVCRWGATTGDGWRPKASSHLKY